MTTSAEDSARQTPSCSIMACTFSDGVILGADCISGHDTYIENRAADKLVRITDHIYCCWAGGGSYAQAVSDIVKHQLNFLKMEAGDCPLVETTARLFRKLCYMYREEIQAGVIVAGWDKTNGGQIYSVPVGGMVRRQEVTVDGTGAMYVYGYMDANYKPAMSKAEAVDFVINALTLAILRDEASGSGVRLGVITEAGIDRSVILANQLPKFYQG